MFSRNETPNSHGKESLHKKKKQLQIKILVLRSEKTAKTYKHRVLYYMAVKL